MKPRVALVLGGPWHDFAGFSALATALLRPSAASIDASFDFAALTRLAASRCDVALLFTCVDPPAGLDHTAEEMAALGDWVRQGGGLLALHSTAVAARTHRELAALLGGSFVSHPAKQRFRVAPRGAHALSAGLAPFDVDDERYELDVAAGLDTLLVTNAEGRELPLGWTRHEGRGKVAYVALGHDADTWRLPAFQSLLVEGVAWLAEREA